MNSKPDKECEKRGDIVLLSEIIANFIYWQGICTRCLAVATTYMEPTNSLSTFRLDGNRNNSHI